MESLLEYLESRPRGSISDARKLGHLLYRCWQEFDGGDAEGMSGSRLLGRMEGVDWNPPLLSFRLMETGLGVDIWHLDVSAKTARCSPYRSQQANARTPRLNVRPLADEVVELILMGQTDERLKWREDGTVHVQIGKILPALSAAKRTLEGRRKIFRQRVDEQIGAAGWKRVRANVYLPPNTPPA